MTRRGVYWTAGVALAALLAAVAMSGRDSESADALASARLVSGRAPATAPSGRNSDPLLPPEFAILQTRDAFGKGHAQRGGGLEATFVFKGAVQAGSTFTAFIEDLSAHRVVQAAVGDSVARGHIKSINLDSVEYAVADDCRRIEVGQDFDGTMVRPTPPASRPSKADPGEAAPANPPPAQ